MLVLLFATAGFGQLQLLPAFAHDQASVPATAIGLAFLANTLAVAVGQLPVLRAVRGRRRLACLALMDTVCAAAWIAILFAGFALSGWAAAACIIAGGGLFGFGECFLPIQSALIADVAPEQLRGRYLALVSTSTQLGLVLGPLLGGLLLAHAPNLLWPAAAAVLLAGAARALALQSRLPERFQRVPAPDG